MNNYMSRLLTAILVLSLAVTESLAQSGSSTQAQETVVVNKLFPPVYPPIARQARIAGDVELILVVRRDGNLDSVSVVSGHRLLKQAAMDSAQRSQFECRTCPEGVQSFHMLYSFQLGPAKSCTDTSETSKGDQKEELYPRVIQSQNHVTVIDQPVGICDPVGAITTTKFRSAKCLYLWRCGSHVEELY